MNDMDWSKMNPIVMWRDWILKNEGMWSEGMAKMLTDPNTSGAMSKQVDELRMMHRLFGEMAQSSLAAANLPSRNDFEALDERMGRIEDALAQLTAELAQWRGALAASVPAAMPVKPTRDRRPPAKKSAAKG